MWGRQCGRTGEAWQSTYHDAYNPDMKTCWPMVPVGIYPAESAELGSGSGDIIELHNDCGPTYATSDITEDAKRNYVFVQLGRDNGIQGDVTTEVFERNVSRSDHRESCKRGTQGAPSVSGKTPGMAASPDASGTMIPFPLCCFWSYYADRLSPAAKPV